MKILLNFIFLISFFFIFNGCAPRIVTDGKYFYEEKPKDHGKPYNGIIIGHVGSYQPEGDYYDYTKKAWKRKQPDGSFKTQAELDKEYKEWKNSKPETEAKKSEPIKKQALDIKHKPMGQIKQSVQLMNKSINGVGIGNNSIGGDSGSSDGH